eukprot:129809-Rhodomonas_salina.2
MVSTALSPGCWRQGSRPIGASGRGQRNRILRQRVSQGAPGARLAQTLPCAGHAACSQTYAIGSPASNKAKALAAWLQIDVTRRVDAGRQRRWKRAHWSRSHDLWEGLRTGCSSISRFSLCAYAPLLWMLHAVRLQSRSQSKFPPGHRLSLRGCDRRRAAA